MNEFKSLDDVLTAIETLSDTDIDNGALVELSYQAGVRVKGWSITIDCVRPKLIEAAKQAGIDHSDAIFDVNEGLTDGAEALRALCNLRVGHPVRQGVSNHGD